MALNSRWMAGVCAVAVAGAALATANDADRVEITDRPDARRVDIAIGGTPFTAYAYGTAVKKPILFPIRTARGTIVTRGVPLEPRPGERADHPHHAGHWFNHGDVNGFDFWGHSDETPAVLRGRAGTIVHRAVTRAESGPGRGTLAVAADWVVPDGTVLLTETTEFVFRGGAGWRAIDRTTTWRAAGKALVFGDTKEGSFGIRVARSLEHPSKEAGTFVNAAGQVERLAALDQAGITGRYLASDGRSGEGVWGSRGPWMALTGTVDGEDVTLAIFDAPGNPGHPTHWHARGYGLFAANPFGSHGFDAKRPAAPTTLDAGAALVFRHRILVRSGHRSRAALQADYARFLTER